jgi:hypothetical protein
MNQRNWFGAAALNISLGSLVRVYGLDPIVHFGNLKARGMEH